MDRWRCGRSHDLVQVTARLVDITAQDTDAIVNAANESLAPGGGVCGATAVAVRTVREFGQGLQLIVFACFSAEAERAYRDRL
jgi:O-acetyl-ADP-ribose deacetylase (regulator of RNase III)